MKSRYASKTIRLYAPCRTGKEDLFKAGEIENIKHWVSRIRHRTNDHSRAVTLEDIENEKARTP